MVTKPYHNNLTTTILCLFLVATTVAAHSATKECICLKEVERHEEHHASERQVLTYKVVAIIAILFSSAFGFFLPIVANNIPALRPETGSFFLVKAYSAGIILCTAFIHILLEAFENLTSPCLGGIDSPWAKFPFTGLAIMAGVLLTLTMGSIGSRHYNRAALVDDSSDDGDKEDARAALPNNNHLVGHDRCTASLIPRKEDGLIQHKITSQVLEIGIVVHSVTIGLSLGTSKELDSIKPLTIALCFHQFFEGIGLAGCIVQASFKSFSTMLMAIGFILTTPLGIAIGIAATDVYDDTNRGTLISKGILNAVAAGILIYMALIDLLVADFMDPKIQTSTKLFFGAKFTLLLGAASMTVLAIWA